VSRLRLGVVLLVPEPVAAEVDGLRRAFGDPVLGQVASHVTLVPPVNVRREDVPHALRVLRDAAAEAAPLDLDLGPVAAFPGDEGVAYLEVGGDADALDELRQAVFRAPLERRLDHDFVPHVTLTQGVDAARLGAVLTAAADWGVVRVRMDSVHLLEERHTEAGRQWAPIADVPFGPRAVVGRGGLELELTASELVDPEAAAALDGGEEPARVFAPPGARPLVVTGRREGEVVGLARGWTVAAGDDDLDGVWLAPGHLDDVEGHVRAAWHAAAARRRS
jgi:2'-5' RNA ligase